VLQLATDADFNGNILGGLLKLQPDLDVVRVQDVGLRTASDPEILDWAAKENRVLLTHDRTTMSDHAYDRVRAGELMPGVIVVRNQMPLGPIIDDLLLIALASSAEDWIDQVVFLWRSN